MLWISIWIEKCAEASHDESFATLIKGHATKGGLSIHIILNHFTKFHCEVTRCSSILSSKSKYKFHCKTVHKKYDQILIGDLLIKLEKLKPNFQQLKYV